MLEWTFTEIERPGFTITYPSFISFRINGLVEDWQNFPAVCYAENIQTVKLVIWIMIIDFSEKKPAYYFFLPGRKLLVT